jgi:hypothetical protein
VGVGKGLLNWFALLVLLLVGGNRICAGRSFFYTLLAAGSWGSETGQGGYLLTDLELHGSGILACVRVPRTL